MIQRMNGMEWNGVDVKVTAEVNVLAGRVCRGRAGLIQPSL